MGWAYCGTDRYGREIGYGIQATCDRRGCGEEINRGLGCVCGGLMHLGDEGGCGRYYCDAHGGGWGVGPRGGCQHRGKLAWGKTRCQLLRKDDSERPIKGHDGKRYTFLNARYYCACHSWEYDGPQIVAPGPDDPRDSRDRILMNPSLVPGFIEHINERGFASHMDGVDDEDAAEAYG